MVGTYLGDQISASQKLKSLYLYMGVFGIAAQNANCLFLRATELFGLRSFGEIDTGTCGRFVN
jgi:hypothetical protein